jgi:hypothetical protein
MVLVACAASRRAGGTDCIKVTLYSSAASRETLAFLVIAISVLGPGTIAYHVYANWVFRGRQPLDGAAVPGDCPAAPSAVPSPRPAEGGN